MNGNKFGHHEIYSHRLKTRESNTQQPLRIPISNHLQLRLIDKPTVPQPPHELITIPIGRNGIINTKHNPRRIDATQHRRERRQRELPARRNPHIVVPHIVQTPLSLLLHHVEEGFEAVEPEGHSLAHVPEDHLEVRIFVKEATSPCAEEAEACVDVPAVAVGGERRLHQ